MGSPISHLLPKIFISNFESFLLNCDLPSEKLHFFWSLFWMLMNICISIGTECNQKKFVIQNEIDNIMPFSKIKITKSITLDYDIYRTPTTIGWVIHYKSYRSFKFNGHDFIFSYIDQWHSLQLKKNFKNILT